jgi:hypothetical protein
LARASGERKPGAVSSRVHRLSPDRGCNEKAAGAIGADRRPSSRAALDY